jgi:hypothetical protein
MIDNMPALMSWKGATMPWSEYDHYLHPDALAYLDGLRAIPSGNWLIRFIRRRRLVRASSRNVASFICRNPFDPTSKLIGDEFQRVYGRSYNPIWD